MIKTRLKNILFSLLYSLILMVVGYLIAIPISHRFHYTLQDVMFLEGTIVVIIGTLLSMKGSPSCISLQGLGQRYAQYSSNENLEVTKIERKTTDYNKNPLIHSILELAFGGLTMIIGGFLIIILSVFSGW
jgi:hypothetical protein